jgi:hypothetical protein
MRQFRYPRIKGAVRVGKATNSSLLQKLKGPLDYGPLGRLLARWAS